MDGPYRVLSSIQLLFNQRPIWLIIVSSTQLLVNKDFFRISILNITTDAGNGGLIPLFCNVQHSSARVNLRVGLLLDRSLVSSVLHATVRTLKPEKPKKLLFKPRFLPALIMGDSKMCWLLCGLICNLKMPMREPRNCIQVLARHQTEFRYSNVHKYGKLPRTTYCQVCKCCSYIILSAREMRIHMNN